MIKLICDKLQRILKNKKRLEELLEVKIINRGIEVQIDGESEAEYIAEKVLQALNFGFPYSTAILIKTEDLILGRINIKDHTTKKDFVRVKARIIGTKGKTLKTLCTLTNCYFEIKDKEIGIIGDPEYIENANQAVISLIKGTKQSNVYSYLEKHQIKPEADLGLKEIKKK
jgi:KH domain-containing protein